MAEIEQEYVGTEARRQGAVKALQPIMEETTGCSLFLSIATESNWFCSVQGDKDFTPAAAQVAHQKPQPGVPKHAPIQHIKPQIHQPRK